MRATDQIARWAHRGLLYLLLTAGAIVFAWPLAWMLLASIKTEREFSNPAAGVLPAAPRPRRQSPYVDGSRFAGPATASGRAVLAAIERQLRAAPTAWPAAVDPDQMTVAVARGLFQHLRLSQPAAWWRQAPAALAASLPRLIGDREVAETQAQVERSLLLGNLTATADDLTQDVLAPPDREAGTWQIGGPAAARFTAPLPGLPAGRLQYDFSSGDRVQLTRTFTTTFPVSRLRRLQVFLRADASWNRLYATVEMDGRQYRAERPITLADDNWSEATWQRPSADDQSNQLRTWILWREVAHGPQFATDPHQIRITLEIVRSGWLRAWWEKITQNYQQTLNYIPFWRYVATSVFLVILQLVGTLFSCSLVAYSFARLRWPGRRLCFLLMIATMVVPSQVTMIPHFLIMRALGWYNTLYPLWTGSLLANAFFVFLLHQFLRGLPRDLEDAARIDGCSYWQIYWHVVLPLIRPSLAAIAIFTFIGAWNDFTGPLLFVSDQRLYPLSFGLYALNVQSGGTTTIMMAGSLLMTLPVIVLFLFAQRYFIEGITFTGMK
ncbi:MAG TPA: carbohydrate ABC transporter permease [Candidatus Baltobacteraceae bacterium]|nr:carbohydrate ABC transporter permease [Candidatus Baltobacteraceae bacterium]